jgi:hypothetical protein
VIERAKAVTAAQEWIDAWNAHDPERVVAHFADDVVVSSPVAARLRPGSDGVLRGRAEVLSYYRDGLAAVPDLRFTLIEVCAGVDEFTIVYRNQSDVVVTETLLAGADGRAREVRVAYGA